jgi:cytochrome P450
MAYWNPYDRDVVTHPYPVYKQLRDEAPVYRSDELDLYALTRYEDVVAAHLDPHTYSSTHGVTIEGVDAGAPYLIAQDPPKHTWHRKIVSRVFTPRRINDLEPFIRHRAAELLDAGLRDGRIDAVQDFSMRLPLDVISELIGIPEEQREQVHLLRTGSAMRWGETRVRRPSAMWRSCAPSSCASSSSGAGRPATTSSAC